MNTNDNSILYQDINSIDWIVGVYARVSTDHDEQRLSTEHQQQFFTEWCKNHNMEIYDYYVDDGKSGTTIKKRYDFQRMIDDARHGRINCIVARSITRFARNQVDTLRIIRELQVKGVRFVFIEQALDTYKNDGLLGLFAWLAEEESRTTSTRRKLGGRQAQKNGRFTTSRPPFGYKSVEQRLVVDEEESPIVREIFNLYLSGYGCKRIATILNDKGYKTRNNYGFDKGKIQYMIKNEAYKGWIVGNKRSVLDPINKKTIENPPEKWVINKNAHVPIISEEDFDKAQEIMSDKSFTITKRTTYILTGIIKCKECGRNMMRRSNTKKNGKTYAYYICNSRNNKGIAVCDNDTIKEEILKEVIENELLYLKDNPKLFNELKKEVIEEIKSSGNTFEQDIKNAKTTIERVQLQRERLVEKYIDGIIPDDIYKKKESELSDKIKELSSRKTSAYKNIKNNNRFDKVIKEFENELSDFTNLENTTNARLKKIVKEVWVDKKGNIEIIMKFMPDKSCHYGQTVTTVTPYCKPIEAIGNTRKRIVTSYDRDRDTIYLKINRNLKEVI